MNARIALLFLACCGLSPAQVSLTLANAPPAPASVTLSWSAPAGASVTGFMVQRWAAAGVTPQTWETVATAAPAATGYTDLQYAAAGDYTPCTYRVIATLSGGTTITVGIAATEILPPGFQRTTMHEVLTTDQFARLWYLKHSAPAGATCVRNGTLLVVGVDYILIGNVLRAQKTWAPSDSVVCMYYWVPGK